MASLKSYLCWQPVLQRASGALFRFRVDLAVRKVRYPYSTTQYSASRYSPCRSGLSSHPALGSVFCSA